MKSVIKLHYSSPYERALAALKGERLSEEHDEKVERLVTFLQTIWDSHEEKILKLFEEIYKISINEKEIKSWVSLIAPFSYSDPLTISLIRFEDKIETDQITQRGFIFNLIHELAHYFAYTRPEDSYFEKLRNKVREKNLVDDRGGNLHYLIQAVEFGIGAEIFGEESAFYRRKFIIENIPGEYADSAKLLLEHKVPLSKNCLEFIEKQILGNPE